MLCEGEVILELECYTRHTQKGIGSAIWWSYTSGVSDSEFDDYAPWRWKMTYNDILVGIVIIIRLHSSLLLGQLYYQSWLDVF